MRRLTAIITVLFILLTLASCKNEKKYNTSTFGYDENDFPSMSKADSTSKAASKDSGKKESDKGGTEKKSSSAASLDSKTNNSNTTLKLRASYNINYSDSGLNTVQTVFKTRYWKMPFAKEDGYRCLLRAIFFIWLLM